MPDFLTALLWALTLLLSLAGWGRLTQRLANIPTPTLPDWLDTPTLGLATGACLGGLLNLLHLATRETLLAVGIAGILPLLLDLNHRRKKNPVPQNGPPLSLASRLLLGLVLLLLTLRLLSAIVLTAPDTAGVTLNPHDDMHSYLVSVARMLQTGSLGLDPFNDRLMVSSLGAQNFLNALAIAPLPFDSVHLADNGLALVALTLSTAAIALRAGLTPSLAASLMLIPLAIDWGYSNISANITAAGLLLGLGSSIYVLKASPSPATKIRSLAPTAILLAAVCAVKSTMIPAAAIFLAMFVSIELLRQRRWKPLLITLLVAVIAFLLDLPWMLWQYRSSGTLLYPLLGRGFHAPEPAPSAAILLAPELLQNTVLPFALFAIATVALRLLRRTPALIPLWFSVALLSAWTLAWPIFTYTTQFTDIARYVLPIAVPALIFFLTSTAVAARHLHRPALAVAPLLLFLVVVSRDCCNIYVRDMPHGLYTSLNYISRPWDADAAHLRELQQAIPPGERLLVYLTTPALLDFSRNPIYIIDWPGEVSPHPGLPIDAGPDAIAAYLLSHHIQYVAYSYAAHANFHPQAYAYLLEPSAGRAYNRFAFNAFAFQRALAELARTRKTVYRDTNDIVIDLAQ